MFFFKETYELENVVDFRIDVLRRDSFEPSKEIKMLVGRQLLPQNIKLRTNSNVLSYFVDVVNAVVVDDDLEVSVLVGAQYSS